ncbi:hypothetical protein [Bradyrhizobium macuxiense]|uniref:hypothetical protein n=1 Tax=Bradyrhizobium macuxiense TaxID=1755647 RepID=UPI000B03FC0B|nr:hypothetical protein [Bradyrhizobium macuxiense]
MLNAVSDRTTPSLAIAPAVEVLLDVYGGEHQRLGFAGLLVPGREIQEPPLDKRVGPIGKVANQTSPLPVKFIIQHGITK